MEPMSNENARSHISKQEMSAIRSPFPLKTVRFSVKDGAKTLSNNMSVDCSTKQK